jgi:hypothetical protein
VLAHAKRLLRNRAAPHADVLARERHLIFDTCASSTSIEGAACEPINPAVDQPDIIGLVDHAGILFILTRV